MTADRQTPEQVRIELLTIALRNIAGGYWNAGRAEPISAQEYARQFLMRSHEPPRSSGDEPSTGEAPPASRGAQADATNR